MEHEVEVVIGIGVAFGAGFVNPFCIIMSNEICI